MTLTNFRTIAILGSNPSAAAPEIIPFSITTKSGRFIRKILPPFYSYIFLNVSNTPTQNNRPLTVKEIQDNLDRLREQLCGIDKVVAVGRTAEKALKIMKYRGFIHYLPHPSGQCRVWNDKSAHDEHVHALKIFVKCY